MKNSIFKGVVTGVMVLTIFEFVAKPYVEKWKANSMSTGDTST